MIQINLCSHQFKKNGMPEISPKKPIVYKRGMKKINCIVDIPLKYISGFHPSEKEVLLLENLGLKTIEDLFSVDIEKLSKIIEIKSLRNSIISAYKKIRDREFIYEESLKKGQRSLFNYLKDLLQVKHLNFEEKAIIAGLAVFSPILKVTRRSLIEFKNNLPFLEGRDFHSIKKKAVVKNQIRYQRKLKLRRA